MDDYTLVSINTYIWQRPSNEQLHFLAKEDIFKSMVCNNEIPKRMSFETDKWTILRLFKAGLFKPHSVDLKALSFSITPKWTSQVTAEERYHYLLDKISPSLHLSVFGLRRHYLWVLLNNSNWRQVYKLSKSVFQNIRSLQIYIDVYMIFIPWL